MPTFGPVIAERRLVAHDSGAVVRVTIGAPRSGPNGVDWTCPFRIRGGGLAIVEFGYGVDSMQALATALEGVRYRLDASGLALDWRVGPGRDGVYDGETGFTRSIPIAFGPASRRRLERLVDRELRAEVERLKRRSRATRRPASAKSKVR
jgi:hypothetical protein